MTDVKIQEKLADLDANMQAEALQLVRNIPEDEIKTIELLIEKYEDSNSLLELLGAESGAGALGKNLYDSGSKFFLNIISKAQPVICESHILRAYANNTTVIDTFTVSALIAGGLTGKMTAGINIPLISVIVTRMGIRNFCGKTWDKL